MRASILALAVVLALVAAVRADDDLPHALTGFSGNWESTGTMYLPSWSDDGTCTVGTSAYHYAWFTYTFGTDGVRRMSSFYDFDYVYVYENGFTATAPCTGKGKVWEDDGSGVEYSWDGYAWFAGGVNYTFVIVDYYTSGSFTGQITEGYQSSTSNTTGQRWNPTYITSYGDCSTSDQGEDAPFYDKQWFNVTSTGYYDIEAYFSRTADGRYPSYAYLALFKGNPNATFESDACGAIGDAELIAADYGNYLYSELVAVKLDVGYTYSLVFSAYTDSFWGNYGWRVTTTRRFNFTTPVGTTSSRVGGFTEPPRDTSHYGANCISNTGSYTQMPYAVVTFNVPAYQNFTLRTTEPSDYAFFTYTGENINPPTACMVTGQFIDYRDSGSYRTLGPYSADDYTVVATPWSTSTDATGYYTDVYVVTGPAITSGGPAPVTTTTTQTPVSTTTTAPVSTTVAPITTTTTTRPISTTGNTPSVSTTGIRPVSTTGTVSTTGVRPVTSTTGVRPVTTGSSAATSVRAFVPLALAAMAALFFL